LGWDLAGGLGEKLRSKGPSPRKEKKLQAERPKIEKQG